MISDNLKDIIGDELFNQIKTKVEASPNKDKIHIENVDTESGNYIPKIKFNEINEQLKTAKEEISNRDTQLANLKKSVKGNDDLLQQINDLQTTNSNNKAEFERKEIELKKENAINELLYAAKVRNPKAVKGLIDISKVEYKDEKISGLDEQLESVKKSDPYLFDNSQKPGGVFNPPNGDQGDKTPSQTMNDIIRGSF